MAFQRVRIFNQGVVPGSADEVWAYLTDWAGQRRDPRRAPSRLASSITLEGQPDETPRTRVLVIEGLGTLRETLFHQSDETRHFAYNIEGVGPYGIRNYLATTDVDSIDARRCQVTITARFDLPPDADVTEAKGFIDMAHNRSVMNGLRSYFANGG